MKLAAQTFFSLSLSMIEAKDLTQSGLVMQEYASDLLGSFMTSAGYDSTDVDAIVNHGCWCGKLNLFHPHYSFLGGSEPVDELDELCKDWFQTRHCNDKLEGGSCNDGNGALGMDYLVPGEYTIQVPEISSYGQLKLSNPRFGTGKHSGNLGPEKAIDGIIAWGNEAMSQWNLPNWKNTFFVDLPTNGPVVLDQVVMWPDQKESNHRYFHFKVYADGKLCPSVQGTWLQKIKQHRYTGIQFDCGNRTVSTIKVTNQNNPIIIGELKAFGMSKNGDFKLDESVCTNAADDCSNDTCLVDLHYMNKIVSYYANNTDTFSTNEIKEDGVCVSVPNSGLKRCEGEAPNLKIVNVGKSYSTDNLVDYQLEFYTSMRRWSVSGCTPEVKIDFLDKTIDPITFENYSITGSHSVTRSTNIERRQILPSGIDNVVMKASCSDGWNGYIAINSNSEYYRCTYNGYDEYWVDGNNDSWLYTPANGWALDYGKYNGQEMALDCEKVPAGRSFPDVTADFEFASEPELGDELQI